MNHCKMDHLLHEFFLFLVLQDICLDAKISQLVIILRCLSLTELENKKLILKQNYLLDSVILNRLNSYFTNKIYIG